MSVTAERLDIRAPSGQEEGTRSQVLRWLKAVGDPVAEHEPLIELETDKVTVEVASPGAGVLTEILKQEQDEVAPGELLGRIGPAASAAAASEPAAQVAREHEAAVLSPRQSGAGSGNPAASGAALSRGAPAARQLSPAVRRLLAEHSLDPAAVRGTGEGGRITVADVLREAAEPSQSTRANGAAGGGGAALPRADAVEATGESDAVAGTASHRVPHSAVRKRIAARMVESLLHTAPHVTTVFEVDMSAVLAHRQRHREEFARQGVSLTLTAYFAQAAVTAIREVPEANSRW